MGITKRIQLNTYSAYIFFLLSILIIVLAYILIRIHLDILSGGHLWRQGDWLINNEHHLVRRGIFGSLLFLISDYFSVNPLVLLGVTQGVIIIFVCSILLISVARLGPDTRVLWVALSPAFIFMFWLLDFHGSSKKEILVYLSYSFLVLGIIAGFRSHFFMWLSSLIFILAVLAHEGNFFFLPFFVLALIVFNGGARSQHFYILLLFVIVGSLAGLGYAIAFSKPTDSQYVCQALLERGLEDTLCDGAISFLNLDRDHAIHFVKNQLIYSGLYMSYAMAYILALMPLLSLKPSIISQKTYYFALSVGIVAFFPLFVVAYDWGRWINFYITSVSIILIMHINLKRDLYPLNVNTSPAFKGLVFLHCFLWSMPHCCEPIGFGVAGFIGQTLSQLLFDA